MLLTALQYRLARERATFFRRDAQAELALRNAPIWRKALLALAPQKIGAVAFEQPDCSVAHLPLYLLRHRVCGNRVHTCIVYPSGFPGYNERLECFCGYRHYTLAFCASMNEAWAFARAAWRARRAMTPTPPPAE